MRRTTTAAVYGAREVNDNWVKPEFRSRSILALFTREIMRRGKAYGKSGAEASWLLEDNGLIVKPMRAMGAGERMRWRV